MNLPVTGKDQAVEAPVIVMAAPNGARLTRADHPAVPVTATELADEAEALVDAGVSVLHLHVRDEAGQHTLDVGRYRQAIDAIERRVGHRLLIQVTSEAVGRYTAAEQMDMVRALRPAAVSLALRELCPDASSESAAGTFFAELHESGCWPQYILYSVEELRRFDRLRVAGLFADPEPFVLLVLGHYRSGTDGSVADLDTFLSAFDPTAFPWAVCCFGAAEADVMQAAAQAGGHLRIGFENNRVLPGGGVATHNAELVGATLARIARRPATAEEVRSRFRLR